MAVSLARSDTYSVYNIYIYIILYTIYCIPLLCQSQYNFVIYYYYSIYFLKIDYILYNTKFRSEQQGRADSNHFYVWFACCVSALLLL